MSDERSRWKPPQESEKRRELEFAPRDEYLQQLVDQIPAFLWVIDRDLIVRRIEGGRPMLQTLDRDRLVGLPMAEVTRMGSSPSDLELSIAMHQRVLEGATERYRAAWKGITLEARIRPLRNRHGDIVGILGVGIDVTEQTRMEEQLRATEAQLRQSQKLEALGQLAGGVAHDFNNVLAAIMGYAQLLLEDLSTDNRYQHDLEEIVKAAERAASMTRQLLAFSRQRPFDADRLDLVEVVHDLARMLRALLPATIGLRVSPERGAPPVFVLADRGHLDQVIMNLAVNARDAMPDNGTLSVNVREVTTGEASNVAVLEVHDNGAGMSRDVLMHAFEPFFTTKPPGRGTGLGLATVYGIVRQHSGSIDIDSVVGQGTTVTVRLPIATSGGEPVTRQRERVAAGGGGRVLVVEDEMQVREVAERFLRRAGYDVLTAADAETALASLSANGPVDLVLTDSAMPGMRGEDLATEIGRVQPGLPVILMSGYSDPARPPSNAVTAYIQKPFTMPALLAEVRRAMAPDPPSPE
jgi:two-component system cell cycle sensor histidine kinase/response regulator CckA